MNISEFNPGIKSPQTQTTINPNVDLAVSRRKSIMTDQQRNDIIDYKLNNYLTENFRIQATSLVKKIIRNGDNENYKVGFGIKKK